MNFQRYFIPAIVALSLGSGLSSCLGNDDDDSFDVKDWKNKNETYFIKMEDTIGADNKKVFEKIEPVWAPGVYVLAQWHNDRSLTAGNLVPMDNSTIKMKYEGKYYNGNIFDASYYNYADSLYSCKPNDMIVGVHAVLTQMHVGDSVTCVIPSDAGYGASSSSILPYSTLIFNLKLESITKYEIAK